MQESILQEPSIQELNLQKVINNEVNNDKKDNLIPTIINTLSKGPTEIIKIINSNLISEPIKCDDKCIKGMDTRLIKEGFELKVPNTQLIEEQVLEEQNLANRLHMLLYVWLVITIFIVYVFVICMISENGWNPLANYVLIVILFFSFYYIYKNII